MQSAELRGGTRSGFTWRGGTEGAASGSPGQVHGSSFGTRREERKAGTNVDRQYEQIVTASRS